LNATGSGTRGISTPILSFVIPILRNTIAGQRNICDPRLKSKGGVEKRARPPLNRRFELDEAYFTAASSISGADFSVPQLPAQPQPPDS
jgi:hypothetical protein